MDALAAAQETFDVAFFVFRKREYDFKWLLAIFTVEFIVGHRNLRKTPEQLAFYSILYA